MPTPVAGLVECTIQQVIGALPLSNVFYYWDTLNGTPVSLVGIAADFNLKVVANMPTVQSVSLSYVNVKIRDVLGTLPDLNTSPTPGAGARAGSNMPTFTSIGFTLQGTTKETRSGAKRLGGQTEADIEGNGPIAAYKIIMNTFAAQIALSLVSGATYVPVVFGRVTPTRPTILVNQVASVTANDFVTTQNSRKQLA